MLDKIFSFDFQSVLVCFTLISSFIPFVVEHMQRQLALRAYQGYSGLLLRSRPQKFFATGAKVAKQFLTNSVFQSS